MFESKTITVPKDMPLKDRISEVARHLSVWLSSLGKLSEADRNSLRLTKCEQTSKGYRYHYSISVGEELSASDAKVRAKPSRQPEAVDEDDDNIEPEETGGDPYSASGSTTDLTGFEKTPFSE